MRGDSMPQPGQLGAGAGPPQHRAPNPEPASDMLRTDEPFLHWKPLIGSASWMDRERDDSHLPRGILGKRTCRSSATGRLNPKNGHGGCAGCGRLWFSLSALTSFDAPTTGTK